MTIKQLISDIDMSIKISIKDVYSNEFIYNGFNDCAFNELNDKQLNLKVRFITVKNNNIIIIVNSI